MSAPTTAVAPASPMPSWLAPHLKPSLTGDSAVQKVSMAASSDGLSSWIFDSIASNEPVHKKQFQRSMRAPRILMACSVVGLTLTIFINFTIPSLLISTTFALVFINTATLFLLYHFDSAVKEARSFLTEQAELFKEVRAMNVEIETLAKQRNIYVKTFDKEVAAIEEQRAKLKAVEQAKIASETSSFDTSLINMVKRRHTVDETENKELAISDNSPNGLRLAQIDRDLRILATDERNEVAIALSVLQKDHIDLYLQNQLIASAGINGITPNLVSNLRRAGFQTAYCLVARPSVKVDGIGKVKSGSLNVWKSQCEANAKKSMPMSLPSASANAIAGKYQAKTKTLVAEQAAIRPKQEGERNTIKRKYSLERKKLDDEQTIATNAKNQALIAIKQEYSAEYEKLDAQKLEVKEKLALQLAEMDSRSKEVQKRSFTVNLKMAKFQRKFLPYSNLTFRSYVQEVLFNSPAA